MFNFARLVALALLLPLLFAVTTGCATKGEPARTVRVAVLDGLVEYDVDPKGELTVEGWWFGARDRLRSPNVGIQLGEAIARDLNRVPGVEVFSREDLSIYLAQKERLLKRQHPSLSSLQRKSILLRQDPLDYGRSLNVDYIVLPVVTKSSTVLNRTFSWWYSHLDATVQVYDVDKGQIIWSRRWEDVDYFDSSLAMAEECARSSVSRMKRKDVFGVRPVW
jgi:TolB-like protein